MFTSVITVRDYGALKSYDRIAFAIKKKFASFKFSTKSFLLQVYKRPLLTMSDRFD